MKKTTGYCLFLVLLLSSMLTGCSSAITQPSRPVIAPEKPSAAPIAKHDDQATEDSSTTIALLLPLSGPSQNVGRAMFDAAQLALFSANMPELKLIPIDTEVRDAQIAESTRQAIAKGAKLIIGPLFARNIPMVSRAASPHNINVLSFSNDKTLAGNGVFLLGFMLEEQVRRVTEYAIQQGITNYYALVPATPYGKLAAEHLRNVVVESNGTVERMEFYTSAGDNLALTVKNIADALNNDKSQSVKGLFIPEGGEKLAAITKLLAEYQVDPARIRLIGTGQWDDISTTQNAKLNGGWFASVSPEQHALFEESFQQQYGYKPMRIASLAYDAVALAYSISSQPEGNSFTKETLTNPRGFSGIEGIFRLKQSGITERKLAVLEVGSGTFQVVSPPAQGFDTHAE